MDRRASLTVGVDLGDRYSELCYLSDAGEVLDRVRVRTRPGAFLDALAGYRARVVLEAGTHSRWVSSVVEELGHEVIVANPRRVDLISKSQRKSDVTDAELLARLGRADPALLSPIQHRAETTQVDLAVVQARAAVVRSRTLLVNHCRGIVKAAGERLPSCDASTFHKKLVEVPEELRPVLEPLFASIFSLTTTIGRYDRELDRLCREAHPETELLRRVWGVGPVLALTFILTLDDPSRFERSRDVGPFLGLVPARNQSGGSDPGLRITKAGDVYLRCLLVQSAQRLLRSDAPDTALKRFGERLVARGGKAAKKKAVVATARKLAVLLHHLWRTAEVYEPLHQVEAREE